ncbi:SF1B family DNA helicase RecD2 [Alkalicoccus urumqiensis]|uniref:ATP-dependent RecD2 DNA helicase n=1 Tax=Alkalicoccus urumqiensis TaxID=1548213 RepID=A0A2P6MFJ1_ALKUR|nr:ATP-dependent RecD-like DNA helicase [Alkalicoccus urumqiensis]PRO65027.1 ATP-dependent RecD-like DNA helicase [Alkalicoccus urumqiensis]
MMEDKPYIQGELLHLIYHQEDSLYTVAKIKVDKASDGLREKEAVVVGMMARPDRDTTYIFHGYPTDHPRFGRQFKFETYEKKTPDTKQGLITYFSSDRFPGVGKKTAEAVVETFGTGAISEILARPSRLSEVPKLDGEKAEIIHQQLVEDQGIEEVLMKLHEYGFGLKLAVSIYQAYKTEALQVIEENPYRMVEDVTGVGFVRADQIGRGQGITGEHPDRLKAAVLFTLQEQCLNEGHVYMKTETVIQAALSLLEQGSTEPVEPLRIADVIVELGEEEKLILVDERMYIPSLFFAEQGIATSISRLSEQPVEADFPESEILKAVGDVEEKHSVSYASSQREAIETALSSPMMMLTGGPGTGKTTVIQGVIEVYASLHGLSLSREDYSGSREPYPFLLAAPTGRAAKRMKESTGLPASTIHRLLGYKGVEEEGYEHDEETPLEGRLLILDEMSMVDTWLANQLLRAVPSGMQVVIVGDEDQLPSVGPGQVLTDLLQAGRMPIVRLTDIFRQSENSEIITFSHQVKQGLLPEQIDQSSDDLRFFPARPDTVVDAVCKICSGALAKGYAARDIQVLAPMYKGPAGIDQLNLSLQELFNPKQERTKEITFGDLSYRVGDMVLQLVNNLEENVFNGDRGEIVAILTEKETADKQLQLVISFDGTEVTYGRADLTQITHAYCSSIHKAQGSEYPIVIMPVVRSYYRMLRRKLIYTGITRAKQFLLLCGDWEALSMAVESSRELERNTTLVERLTGEGIPTIEETVDTNAGNSL